MNFILSNILAPNLPLNVTNQTSVKNWTQEFEVPTLRVRQSSKAEYDHVFGPLDPHDHARLASPNSIPSTRIELVDNEGDVVRKFSRDMIPVAEVWDGQYRLDEISENIPVQGTEFKGKVDVQWIKRNTSQGDVTVCIGDLKAPGTIDGSIGGELSSNAKRLLKEARGYAYHCRCPQVFIYDGIIFLAMVFKAKSRKDIKKCEVDAFLVPNIAYQGGTTLRYALYRLISQGVQRELAARAPKIQQGPYERRFDWYNGRYYWFNEDTKIRYQEIEHLTRKWVQQYGRYAWYYGDGFVSYCTDGVL